MKLRLIPSSFINLLKTDFHRAFFSIGFVVSALSSAAVLFYGYYGMYAGIDFADINPVSCFINSFVWGNIIYLMFLTPPLAYSAGFADDWRHGYFRSTIIRSGLKKYAISKCVASSLAGGLSTALGAMLFILFLLIRNSVGYSSYADTNVNISAFHDILKKDRPMLFFLCYLYVIFLQAIFWAALGLLASAYYPSRYVAYATPFVLGYVFHQIAASGVLLPNWLNPVTMATGRMFHTPAWLVLLWETFFFLTLTVISSILFVRKLQRRISNA